ncbi:MAG TPA: hypothetical protein D7H73_02080 [Candidatus Poseidoniales archaeon]|nr:MAG TPA: hypothetical protein D7H73_02080 [Candidatus Poseidoniales archaeon]
MTSFRGLQKGPISVKSVKLYNNGSYDSTGLAMVLSSSFKTHVWIHFDTKTRAACPDFHALFISSTELNARLSQSALAEPLWACLHFHIQ